MIRVLLTGLCMTVILVVAAAAVLIDLAIKLLPLILVGLVARLLWTRRYRRFGPPPAVPTLQHRPHGRAITPSAARQLLPARPAAIAAHRYRTVYVGQLPAASGNGGWRG